MTEHGQPVLVVSQVMKPIGYRQTDELSISQERAVQKVKAELEKTRRLGATSKIMAATLEYEDVGRRNGDGSMELVPVWRVDIESEQGRAISYVSALEVEE